jgi:hypothetical protein
MQVLDDPCADDVIMAKTAWSQLIEAAEKFNEPGRFSAIIEFE